MAQKELERRPTLPFFLLTDTQDLTLAANHNELTLPTGFIREYEEGGVYRLGDEEEESWEKLGKLTHNQAIRHSGSGTPSCYAILGNTLSVYPTPTTEETIRLVHYASATALDTNVSNGWLQHAPELLILLTEARCKPGAAEFARQEAERQWMLLADETFRRRFEQQSLVIEVN
ncbi:MAG: hypothetical protein HQM00_02285 [Magnetococcales bacterium]|nr:hypothetical protein [Magnetococcales bacterium]